MPDEIKDKFNPAEIFVLLYAVYLHDIGYLTTKLGHEKSGYGEIINNHQKYGLSRFEANAVADVCYGHASEVEKPLKEISERSGVASLGQNNPMNLRFLAALLRLTDEIDNAYTRVIGYPDQSESMRHLVSFVDINTVLWTIRFQTKPNNGDDWEKLNVMRKYA